MKAKVPKMYPKHKLCSYYLVVLCSEAPVIFSKKKNIYNKFSLFVSPNQTRGSARCHAKCVETCTSAATAQCENTQ